MIVILCANLMQPCNRPTVLAYGQTGTGKTFTMEGHSYQVKTPSLRGFLSLVNVYTFFGFWSDTCYPHGALPFKNEK